ncbi:MAG: GAF domain containing protein [Gemmatimonadales bacterium]|nr:MAG: GAF domain containing protein [Gemmatimonadales bacterium]
MAVEAVLKPEPIVRALRAAFAREATRQELLAMAAKSIRQAGPPYTSVYLYMLHGDELVLEAYDGRDTPHTRIPVGKGLCGQAVAEGKDINAPDVSAAPGYLACNLETKSELVVLIRRGDEILGQIDIDSDVPAGFSEAEHRAVKQVADALAVLL